MTPQIAATPASARTENGRRNLEQLGGGLDDIDNAAWRRTQLALDGVWLRRAHLAELGGLLIRAGHLLTAAADEGSYAVIESALRVARAVVVDAIACLRGRAV